MHSRSMAKIAALALAYVLGGWFGLALAIPPGYATGIFPPAGIALICVLAFGYRVLPGVWLGSFVLNAVIVGPAGSPGAVALAAALATGACLQALAGAWLVRWRPGYPSSLSRARDALQFVLLGGAVACVVSPTVGVTTLWLSGRLPTSEYAINWFTWWVGDALGVFVAGPLAWAVVGAPVAVWRGRRSTLFPALLGTLGIVVGIFLIGAGKERQSIARDFEDSATQGANVLRSAIARNLDALFATERFVASVGTDVLDRERFRLFAGPQRDINPNLQGLSWNPWVPRTGLADFLQRMSALGGPTMMFQRNASGGLEPVGDRPAYMPVAFIEPLDENSTAVGFDILSSPARAAAVASARDTGEVVSTGRIRLVQVDDDQFGGLVMYPHYRGGRLPPTLEEREREFLGVAVAVFRWGDIGAAVNAAFGGEGVSACLVDLWAASGEQRLFGPHGCELPSAENGLVLTSSVSSLGRPLELRVTATPAFVAANRGWQSWTLLVGGVVFTGLLGLLLLVVTGSRAQMEALVEQRTRELSDSVAGLAEARNRLELSLESSQLGMWDWHIESGQVLLSEGWRAIAGREAPLRYGSLGDLVRTFFSPDDFDALRERLIPVLKGDEPYFRTTVRTWLGDGRQIWVHCHGKVVARDDKGRALRVVGTCANVTEQVESEALLREREAQLRLVTENVPALIAHFDRNMKLLFANRQFGGVFGDRTASPLIGADLDLLPGDATADCMKAHFDEVLSGKPTSFEFALPGSESGAAGRVMHCHLVPDVDGVEVRGCIALISDISDQKHLESALLQREAQIRLGVEAGGVFPWEWDVASRKLRWARSPEELIGVELVEDMRPFIHPDDLVRYKAAGAATILRGEPYVLDARIVDVHGTERWLAARGEGMKGHDGRVVKAFGVVIDISLRKQMEAALEVARQSAESASRAKSDFLANLSHEIRTPLNAVLGMTELVLESELETDQRGMLESSLYAGRALLQMINDLLDFAKTEAGHLDLVEAHFSLRTLMRNTVRPFAMRAADKGLAFRFDVATDVPDWLLGDSGRLRQILFNLLGNALKFTAEGGITVSVGADALTDDSCMLSCSVCDTGIGVPSDMRERIFDAFTQVDASTTREYGGTGLGLSIVRQLTHAMRGRISVTDGEGGGSCFRFSVRVARGQGIAPVVGDYHGGPVVVAAESEALRGTLVAWLTAWGLHAREVESADRIDAALDGRPDLLIASSAMIEAGLSRVGECFAGAGQAPRIIPLDRGALVGLPAGLACDPLDKPLSQRQLMDRLVECLESRQRAEKVADLPEQIGATVMVVEDNAVNRQLASRMLGRLGHRVVTAENGREALEMLATNRCDIVFMDMQMPVLGGLDATRMLREMEAEKGVEPVPVIALTANSHELDRQRCVEAGMNDFLSKPFRKVDLARMIARWFGSGSSPQHVTHAVPGDVGTRRSAPPPGIDMAWVRPLQEALEDDFDLIVRQVLDEMPGAMALLRSAFERGDPDALRQSAHALKGLVQSIGAMRLGELALAIEQAGRQQKNEGVAALLVQTEEEARVVTEALKALLE